ncbi:hypothetical protein ACQY0O_006081 [Thecaphora frezii]
MAGLLEVLKDVARVFHRFEHANVIPYAVTETSTNALKHPHTNFIQAYDLGKIKCDLALLPRPVEESGDDDASTQEGHDKTGDTGPEVGAQTGLEENGDWSGAAKRGKTRHAVPTTNDTVTSTAAVLTNHRHQRLGNRLNRQRETDFTTRPPASADPARIDHRWRDALAVIDVKLKGDPLVDEHQLNKYMTAITLSSPGFGSLYAILVDTKQVRLYLADADGLQLVWHFALDSDPCFLFEVGRLLLGLCLKKSGYPSLRRCIDLAKHRALYLQNQDGQNARAYQPIVYRFAHHADGATAAEPCDHAPWIWWYHGKPGHRYTAVARVSILRTAEEAGSSDAWIPATIKLSHLDPKSSWVEGDVLSVIDRFRRNLHNDADNERLKRCAHVLPNILDYGVLFLSAQEAGVTSEPLAASAPAATCDRRPQLTDMFCRRGLVHDTANNVVSPKSKSGRMPVAVITKHDVASPSRELSSAPAALLPAIIGSVIEALHSFCRSAKVVHCDISPNNIPWCEPSQEQTQLLFHASPGAEHPMLGWLIDFGESFAETEEGQTISAGGLHRFVSGTHLFWSSRAYNNQERLMQIERRNTRGYVHEKVLLDSMEALQIDDDIESALLVLAYELCDRFNLYDCKEQPSYYLHEWLNSTFDERKERLGSAQTRYAYMERMFSHPRATLEASRRTEAEACDEARAAEVLAMVKAGMLSCFGRYVKSNKRKAEEGDGGEVAVEVDKVVETLYEMTRGLLELQEKGWDIDTKVSEVVRYRA